MCSSDLPGIKFDQPSQTLQAFKDDADINCIISRFGNTGVLVDPTVPVSRTPQFGDFSDMPSYQEAQNVIVAANNAFGHLSTGPEGTSGVPSIGLSIIPSLIASA